MCKGNSVLSVIQQALCCACGSCVANCPVCAISLQYSVSGFLRAQVDEKKCISCGICLKSCPSWHENVVSTMKEYSSNWYIGNVIASYIGHVNNQEQRFCGQSGGVITGLLAWLKDIGYIDAAAVADFLPDKQRVGAVLAKTVEEIYASAGSYYVQVPILEAVFSATNDERLAVVCTGCQSAALRLAEKKNKIKTPYLVIGVACEGEYALGMMKELIGDKSKFGEVKKFRFRDKCNGGWPGGVHIEYVNEKERDLPIQKRGELKPYYAAYRCQQCVDMNNIHADIVCGDPWFMQKHLSMESRTLGETIVVARSKRGEEVLRMAMQTGILQLKEIERDRYFLHNSFNEGRVARNCLTQEICRENNLPLLYASINLRESIPREERKKLIHINGLKKHILYTWSYYNAKTEEEALQLINRRKREDMVLRIIKLPYSLSITLLVKIKHSVEHLHRIIKNMIK